MEVYYLKNFLYVAIISSLNAAHPLSIEKKLTEKNDDIEKNNLIDTLSSLRLFQSNRKEEDKEEEEENCQTEIYKKQLEKKTTKAQRMMTSLADFWHRVQLRSSENDIPFYYH
ncbi:unnamed protein product [Rotaria socialis]